MLKYDQKLGEYKVGLKYDHLAYTLVIEGFNLPEGADKVSISSMF